MMSLLLDEVALAALRLARGGGGGEPLQHITGRAHFRYLELDVGPGVFVPRPETEVMTGWAIGRLRDMDVAEPVVADLGTGSGAIALAIGQGGPPARGPGGAPGPPAGEGRPGAGGGRPGYRVGRDRAAHRAGGPPGQGAGGRGRSARP